MANIEHSTLGYAEQHVAHFKEYANSTAREAASGLVAGDDHKVALQTDDHTYWVLTDYSGPTWVQISADVVGTGLAGGAGTALSVDGIVEQGSDADELKVKVIEIGTWDMDADASKAINHGVTSGNIRSVDILIRNDADTATTPGETASANTLGLSYIISTNQITMSRFNAAKYDNANYDTMGDDGNRGWVTIWYVP